MRKRVAAILVLAFIIPLVPLSTASSALGSDPMSKCSYRQLEVAVAWGPGAAAGNVGFPFIIANIGKSTCTLGGYPKLIFTPDRYKGHTIKVEHSGGMIYRYVKPRLVTLKPGADASFGLNYGDASNRTPIRGAMPCSEHLRHIACSNEHIRSELETMVNFNFCFADFNVGVTAIQPGPLPKRVSSGKLPRTWLECLQLLIAASDW